MGFDRNSTTRQISPMPENNLSLAASIFQATWGLWLDGGRI